MKLACSDQGASLTRRRPAEWSQDGRGKRFRAQPDTIMLLHLLALVCEGTEVKGWSSRVRFLHPPGTQRTAQHFSEVGKAQPPPFAGAELVSMG